MTTDPETISGTKVNIIAEHLIKSFEGLRLQAYCCPAGMKTIGWGHVIKPSDKVIESITEEQADDLLEQDIAKSKRAIYRYYPMRLSLPQEGALISFVFNCGVGAFQASSLRQKLLRGEYLLAADEFPKWVHVQGVKLKGLVRRRLIEREVFLQGMDDMHHQFI